MTAALFSAALYWVGLSWALTARARLGIVFCCAIAYPVGLVLWVLTSLGLLVLGVPYLEGPVAVTWTTLAVMGAIAQRVVSTPHFSRREFAILGSLTAAFALVLAVLVRWNLSVWTYDSHVIVSLGRSIAYHGAIPLELGSELASRGIVQVMLHGASVLLDLPYLYSAPPLLAASFLGLFGVLACRALNGPGRPALETVALVALATAAMGTIYFVVVQYFYMHENFAAAAFLFFFCACLWLADRELEPAWLAFGFFFLLAFSLNRIEAPIIAAPIALIAHSRSRLPNRTLNAWALAYVVALATWYAVLLGYLGDREFRLRAGPQTLSASRIAWIFGGTVACFAAGCLVRLPRFARLRRWVPAGILGALTAGVVAAVMLRPDHMAESAVAIVANLRDPAWGGTWYVIAVLAALSVALPRDPLHSLFTYGSGVLLAVVYLLSFNRVPYMVKWGDSGHRMLLSAVPLCFFYLLTTYGPATLGHSSRDSEEKTKGLLEP